MVTFRWRDSAHLNKKRLMTLPINEFLRRLLLHVLPPGFVRIRYFGWMAHRRPNQVGCSKLSPRKKALAHHRRFGIVPNAVGSWSLSKHSPPCSFDGGLRPFPPSYSHDSIFLITAHHTCVRVARRRAAKLRKYTSRQPLETPIGHTFSQSSALSTNT
jgi:hypothetical protein